MFEIFRRRRFPDRELARQVLTWIPLGKTITVRYGYHWIEQATMTEDGIVFHDGIKTIQS